ncbi:MAG: type II secretion system protein GspG, partial [Opitutaceae bacterium]
VVDMFVYQSINSALIPYRIDVGEYPNTEEGLNALMVAPTGKEEKWKGPYLRELPDDPWGNPYQYRYPSSDTEKAYAVWSLGPDGITSSDDICNWKEPSS